MPQHRESIVGEGCWTRRSAWVLLQTLGFCHDGTHHKKWQAIWCVSGNTSISNNQDIERLGPQIHLFRTLRWV